MLTYLTPFPIVNTTSEITNASTIGNLSADPLDAIRFSHGALAILAIIFGIITSASVLGNLMVILAVTLDRDLKRPQYYLILSLAVADIMVGLAVMPLAALYDLRHQRWMLGEAMCDFWISLDVLSCTASILHLVAIALDRYYSVTNVRYSQNRTSPRICKLNMVWICADQRWNRVTMQGPGDPASV